MASSGKLLMNKALLNLKFHAAQKDRQNTVYAPLNILIITVTDEVCSLDSAFQKEHDGDHDDTLVSPTMHD